MIKINFNRNDTINTIAESIFVNLNDDLFKTRFMELSTDVKRKLKVYSPLLLEKLHEDLELFSWTDLLLLENIFHFSVKDINGKVFSFKEIEIMFLRCDDFNITFNKVFAENLADNDFCSYLIDNLMDFIKKRFDRVLSNSSFALPSLRPREEVNSNISEDEQLGFTRLEKENPGLIDINYDIDGFSFCIHSYEEGDICTNFHLEFNETKETQIFSKRPICEVLKVSMSDLYHCKIGECSTHMGRVSVFFVIPSVNDNFNTSEFVEQLYTAAGKNVSSRDKITCVIPVNGLLLFFSTMKFNYPTSFIFLESYGNKAYLSSRSFSSIYSTLKTIFSERIIMEMNIDIGLTVTVEDGKALFLEPDAFKLLSVIPNYKLFFCDSMGNYHKRYFNLCNRVLTYGYGPVRKINFYSLFEDCFSNFRKLSFFPSISFNMIKNNFYGFVYKLKEVRKFEEVIGDAFEKLRSENRIGYRLELTTTGMFVPVIFNVIDSFVRRDIWLSINLNVCRDIIVGNINLMIGLIGGNTILDLGRNVILETIIKEFYVKGCKTNKHFLPDSVIPQIKGLYNRAGIRYLGNLNNFQYEVEDVVQMLYKVISITNNHLNDDFCNIVNSFLFILSSASLNNSVCVIINQYIVDNIRYFKILHQVKLNYNSLENRNALLDIKEGSISLSYYLGHFFVGDFPKDNNFSYYFMIKLLKEKFNLDTNQFLDIVYTMFRRYRLNLVFKPVKKGHTGKILIPVNLGTKVVSIINKSEYISRLDSEVETFKRVVNLPSLTCERANWSEEDKTRLIHGLIKYSGSNSRWSLIKANFFYGLYLTRSPKNAHSDAYKNILRKNSLYRYVELAIRWRPENHCWGDHLRSFKVQIPEDEPFRRTYKDLYNFDLENFSHITSDDLENFFYGFLQQRYISYDEYDSLLGRLLERGDNSQALSNPFLNEQYQPFDFNSNETVFILQRPLNDNIPQLVEVLNASPISEASPVASHQIK